jgi:hypothetical protein
MEKKQISIFILIAVLIGIGIGILIWNLLSPKLGQGIFYYRIENNKAQLFLITGKGGGKEITSFPARELDLGEYRPPRRTYISHNGKQMIYFKQVGEAPIEDFSEGGDIVVSRIVYEPTLVHLKTTKEEKINRPIDSSSLVFSPNDEEIAWIREIEEATYQGIEESGKKRELWLSRADGGNGELLASFDENVILLKRWSEDYIYFQGLWDANIRSLGRINIKTKKRDYLVPRYCEKFLENCKNIEFSPSGRYFVYEIYSKTGDKEITEVYLGDFDKREFSEILTTDRISDRLWLSNEKGFFYTEQEMIRKQGGGGQKEVKETIHLVNLKNQTDDEIYAGSYISQLTLDSGNRYLYFLEKQRETENDFNLVRLDTKTKETEIILTEDYNHILLIR